MKYFPPFYQKNPLGRGNVPPIPPTYPVSVRLNRPHLPSFPSGKFPLILQRFSVCSGLYRSFFVAYPISGGVNAILSTPAGPGGKKGPIKDCFKWYSRLIYLPFWDRIGSQDMQGLLSVTIYSWMERVEGLIRRVVHICPWFQAIEERRGLIGIWGILGLNLGKWLTGGRYLHQYYKLDIRLSNFA